MNKTEIHAKWRVLPVHLVAKLLGVLVHVEGMPFGSARNYLSSAEKSIGVSGGPICSSVPACASAPPETCCSHKNR